MAMEACGEEGQVKLMRVTKFALKAINRPWASDQVLCCLSHSPCIPSFLDSTSRHLKIELEKVRRRILSDFENLVVLDITATTTYEPPLRLENLHLYAAILMCLIPDRVGFGIIFEALNSPGRYVEYQSVNPAGSVLPPAVPIKKASDNTSSNISKDPVFNNQQKFAGKRGNPNGIMPPFSSTGMPPSSWIPNKVVPVSETGFKGNGETGGKGFMPMPGGNEYTRPPFQRGVRSFHPHGDSNSYSHSYGYMPNNIHEKRRLNYDWNSQQALYGIDNTTMYQRVGPRNMGRPPAPLVPPNHGLKKHPGFQAMPTYYFPPRPQHLDSVRGGPYFAQAPPSSVHSGHDPHLRTTVVKQIEYYFSVENLCRDAFLRQNMDGQGWVLVSLIAGFRRVRRLTSDINLILNALQNSSVVEVKASKIRRRGDWSKWLLPNVDNRPMLRTQPQGTSINVKTNNVEKDGPLDGQITSVSSRQLIGSPLTENEVQSGVSSRSDTTSYHGLTKRNFPEGDVIKGFLDIRINDMG